ncbi:DnaD domain-containing protein [Bacillus tianshenii]|nr:DnaD domain-containing protein [Bacillus tianshenii]
MDRGQMIDWLAKGNTTVPLLLMEHYAKIGLNEHEMMLILHVQTYVERGNHFPTPDELSERMSVDVEACTNLLRSLLRKGALGIEEEKDISGVIYERYTLHPLWEKVCHYLEQQDKQQEKDLSQEEAAKIFQLFEQEFARPLSPMEYETLTLWIDKENHSPVLIKAALQEAVISGKLNLRYIDRILFEWQKNGIQTVEQAKQRSMNFRQHQTTKRQPQERGNKPINKKAVPFYNWLEQ